MNKHFLFILMTFFSLILAGCQEKTTSRKSSSSNALNCSGNNYYTLPGCVGYCQYNPTASTCTTGNNPSCSGQAYWTTPGCAGFCQYNPTAQACGGSGGSTGTTTGGTTGGTTGTVNSCIVSPYSYQCYCQTYPLATGCPTGTAALNPNWGVHYPGGVPAGSCSTPYLPSGVTQAYEPRSGTVTVAGETSGSIEYSPFSMDAPNYLNTSPQLKSVSQAKQFFITDSMLKVRVKVKPQPESAQTADQMCYGRAYPASSMSGYTKLQYSVKVYSVGAGNSVSYLATLGPFTTGVNSCSPALDLSNYVGMNPNGIVITVTDVKANQNCWDNYTTSGFSTCNAYKNVRSFDCWSVDIQVAADGTKTFD
jgi:hypothetical protein